MKKIIFILIAVALMFSLFSCGVGDNEETVVSGYTAVAIAKNSSYVQNQIASKYGLEIFYTPEWGTCTYDSNDSGTWNVTLKGTISGYTDEYKSDFEWDLKFTAYVTVSSKGNVLTVRVSS